MGLFWLLFPGFNLFDYVLAGGILREPFLVGTKWGIWSKDWGNQILRIEKQTLWPFLWMGFNSLKARATSRRQFTFYH